MQYPACNAHPQGQPMAPMGQEGDYGYIQQQVPIQYYEQPQQQPQLFHANFSQILSSHHAHPQIQTFHQRRQQNQVRNCNSENAETTDTAETQ